MLTHTPAPWSLIERQDGSFLVKAGSWDVAHNQHSGVHPERERANAHLIAAAPDLLEALKAVMAVADRKTNEFDLARAAIAKATTQTC